MQVRVLSCGAEPRVRVPFRPLPGRRNIVCTRDPGWSAEGAERAGSVEAALEAAALNVFVNTRTLPTDPTAQEYADQADAMLTEYRERAQRVSDGVQAALRGRNHG